MSGPEVIDTGGITDANNDHLLSPDGRTLYLSAGDGHIHAVPFEGGPVRRAPQFRRRITYPSSFAICVYVAVGCNCFA